jgi:hypothetical protein
MELRDNLYVLVDGVALVLGVDYPGPVEFEFRQRNVGARPILTTI